MPIPLVALALVIGGMTLELLWSQGAMVALLGAPVAASIGTALIPLGVLPFRGPLSPFR
jgi:hypothetical protein